MSANIWDESDVRCTHKVEMFWYFDVKCVRTWLLPTMSPEIVNECIFLMRNCVVRRISKSIDDANLLAILVEETRDVHIKRYIRWVDDQRDIHEDFFIGPVHIEQTDAKSSYLATKMSSFAFHGHFRTVGSRVTRVNETGWGRRGQRYTRTRLCSLLECICNKHTTV